MLHNSLRRGLIILRALRGEGRGWVLLFVALGWVLSLGSRQIFPVLFPHLQAEFDVSLAELGALYSLLWLAYAVGQFPAGLLADRFGERNMLVTSTVLAGLTMLVLALSFDERSLAAGMMLFGIAIALYGPTRFTVLVNQYDEYDGAAIGLSQAAGNIGNVVLPFVSGLLAVYVVWWMGFLYVLPLFLLTAVGLWMFIPGSTSAAGATDELSMETLRYILRNATRPHPVKLTAILAIIMFTFQGMSSFYPTYLIEVKGLSPGLATSLYALLFASAILIQPVAGGLGDLFRTRSILVILVGTYSLTLFAIPLGEGMYQMVAITAVLGSFFGVTPIIIPTLSNVLPADMRSAGLGLLRTGYFFASAAGSILMGAMADAGFFDESFFVLGVTSALSIAIVLSLPSD